MDEGRGVFLVTGAGRGIGREIALSLARQGYRVLLSGRRADQLDAVSRELPGQGHLTMTADVSQHADVSDALRRSGVDRLVGVVANAGIGGENVYGESDRWTDIIATNLTGTYTVVNEALPKLRARTQKYGHVVLISSVLAKLGVPGYTAYCASKAGLLGLMRSWAASWASENILVNAICPGWVDTAMAREGIQGMATAMSRSYEAVHAEQMAAVPLGKMSSPAEIGELVAFLVSPFQHSITGQTIHINNGAIMA